MIAFLTDWGYDSYYVGIAKAVVREINRDVEILDIKDTLVYCRLTGNCQG